MQRRHFLPIALSVASVLLVLVLLPLDPVQVSPPNVGLSSPNCPSPFQGNGCIVHGPGIYHGTASIIYCFFGQGTLYLNNTLYAWTSPRLSIGHSSPQPFCPAAE